MSLCLVGVVTTFSLLTLYVLQGNLRIKTIHVNTLKIKEYFPLTLPFPLWQLHFYSLKKKKKYMKLIFVIQIPQYYYATKQWMFPNPTYFFSGSLQWCTCFPDAAVSSIQVKTTSIYSIICHETIEQNIDWRYRYFYWRYWDINNCNIIFM